VAWSVVAWAVGGVVGGRVVWLAWNASRIGCISTGGVGFVDIALRANGGREYDPQVDLDAVVSGGEATRARGETVTQLVRLDTARWAAV